MSNLCAEDRKGPGCGSRGKVARAPLKHDGIIKGESPCSEVRKVKLGPEFRVQTGVAFKSNLGSNLRSKYEGWKIRKLEKLQKSEN